TTHAVLAGGSAAALDAGLREVCVSGRASGCDAGVLGYLNTLLTTLIPETAQTVQPCSQLRGCTNRTDGNASLHADTTPAQAGIDRIYEIAGSAVSQGDQTTGSGAGFKTANFFLRQYAQGIDDCGLALCSAPNVPVQSSAAQKQSPLPAGPS